MTAVAMPAVRVALARLVEKNVAAGRVIEAAAQRADEQGVVGRGGQDR